MEVHVGPGLTRNFCVENRPKIALNQYWYFEVVYNVFLSVMILYIYMYCKKLLVIIWVFCPCQWWVSKKKKFGWGVGGWGELYPNFLGFLECF